VIRRSVLALAAVVATLSMSSCATLESNDDAASVGSHQLTQDDLQVMLESELGQSLIAATPADGVIDANVVRGLIGAWIRSTALKDAGVGDGFDSSAIEESLATSQPSWPTAPQIMRDLAIDVFSVQELLRQGELDEQLVVSTMTAADIDVDSRYGYWNPAAGDAGAVVAFG
jgi:hypothetical protein